MCVSCQICRIWLDQIEHCHVTTRFSHVPCGHFVNKTPSEIVECNFCHCTCEDEVVVRSFHLKITLADESAKVFAWCTGQTAAELLQISPDEFYELPEVIPKLSLSPPPPPTRARARTHKNQKSLPVKHWHFIGGNLWFQHSDNYTGRTLRFTSTICCTLNYLLFTCILKYFAILGLQISLTTNFEVRTS